MTKSKKAPEKRAPKTYGEYKCEYCGKPGVRTRPLQRFCSASHRVLGYMQQHPERYMKDKRSGKDRRYNTFKPKFCVREDCTTLFTPVTVRQIYCSPKCQQRNWERHNRK